jgi:hypothetical protein
MNTVSNSYGTFKCLYSSLGGTYSSCSIYDFGISLVLISKLTLLVSLNKIVDIAIKLFYYGKKRNTRLHMLYHLVTV